jgi:hypothetical protein
VLRRSPGIVDAGADLSDRIQGVVRQVALGAAGLLAHQAHGLQLVEQVAAAHVDVAQAVDRPATGVLGGRHQPLVFGPQRVVVGQRDGIQARLQCALIGHGLDPPPVNEHRGTVAPQRFAVVCPGHQWSAGVGVRHGLNSKKFEESNQRIGALSNNLNNVQNNMQRPINLTLPGVGLS